MKRSLNAWVVALCLVATAAQAQQGGGGGGGRGGGGRGGGRGGGGGAPPSGDGPKAPPAVKQVAANQVDIVGLVKEVGPADRITIDCEEAPALALPAGVRSFVVAKTGLLKDITVGERVRFRLDSQQVSVLAPFDGDRAQLSDGRNKGPGARPGQGYGPDPGEGPGRGF